MPTIGSRAGAGDWERGGRSCKTRGKTIMKPQYSYVQDVIEWYRNVIQRMHAYHWQQSWCGGLGVGGGGAARQEGRQS